MVLAPSKSLISFLRFAQAHGRTVRAFCSLGLGFLVGYVFTVVVFELEPQIFVPFSLVSAAVIFLVTMPDPYPITPLSVHMRFVNAVGRVLDALRLPLFQLKLDNYKALAIRRSGGLTDFGDADYEPYLDHLMESIKREGDVTFLGRILVREYIAQKLCNRLAITNVMKLYGDQIRACKPVAPIIITGLPRGGTTMLHRMLAEDTKLRALLLWEGNQPCLPSGARFDRVSDDPRFHDAVIQARFIQSADPSFDKIHVVGENEAEECLLLLANMFYYMCIVFHVPSYMDWAESSDLTAVYRYHYLQMQMHQWQRRQPAEQTHLLKCPAHLHALDKLLLFYPDARIVWTHRDPKKTVPSWCSFIAHYRRLAAKNLDLKVIGREWPPRLARSTEHAMNVRRQMDAQGRGKQFLDVFYDDMMEDPIGTCKRIYEHYGLSYDDALVGRWQAWLAQNGQHKAGSHAYTMDMYGLTPRGIDACFANYVAAFNIPDEAKRKKGKGAEGKAVGAGEGGKGGGAAGNGEEKKGRWMWLKGKGKKGEGKDGGAQEGNGGGCGGGEAASSTELGIMVVDGDGAEASAPAAGAREAAPAGLPAVTDAGVEVASPVAITPATSTPVLPTTSTAAAAATVDVQMEEGLAAPSRS